MKRKPEIVTITHEVTCCRNCPYLSEYEDNHCVEHFCKHAFHQGTDVIIDDKYFQNGMFHPHCPLKTTELEKKFILEKRS